MMQSKLVAPDLAVRSSRLLDLGEAIIAGAHRFPAKVGARDLSRSLTYREWNRRACRLANALLGLGLSKEGYKRPRSIEIIDDADMPRTATGKVLHRALRDRYAGSD